MTSYRQQKADWIIQSSNVEEIAKKFLYNLQQSFMYTATNGVVFSQKSNFLRDYSHIAIDFFSLISFQDPSNKTNNKYSLKKSDINTLFTSKYPYIDFILKGSNNTEKSGFITNFVKSCLQSIFKQSYDDSGGSKKEHFTFNNNNENDKYFFDIIIGKTIAYPDNTSPKDGIAKMQEECLNSDYAPDIYGDSCVIFNKDDATHSLMFNAVQTDASDNLIWVEPSGFDIAVID